MSNYFGKPCSSYIIKMMSRNNFIVRIIFIMRSLQLCRRIGNVRNSSGSKRRRIAEQTRQDGDLSSFPFLHLDLRQRQVIVLHVLIIVIEVVCFILPIL